MIVSMVIALVMISILGVCAFTKGILKNTFCVLLFSNHSSEDDICDPPSVWCVIVCSVNAFGVSSVDITQVLSYFYVQDH